MQTSSKKLSKKYRQKIDRQFINLLADLNNPSECQSFFTSFLTKTEQNVFTKRLGIIWMLKQEFSYKEIKKQLNVSSATISSIAKQMDDKGTQLLVKKLEIDDWAEGWTERIFGFFSFK